MRILLAFAVLMLTGCGDLVSVEAVANQDNTVFDPALVGAWTSGDAVVIVQSGEEESYRISWLGTEVNTEPPRLIRMEGRLAKLGEQRMLDLSTAEASAGAFTIPGHVFLRVRPVKDGLKVQFVDSLWMREQVKASSIAYFTEGFHPVLTAPSAQVAAFLIKFGFDERALVDPIMLRPLKQK
jgi:hypothetical protein